MDAVKIEDSFNRAARPFGRSFRIEEEESEEDQAFEDQWTMEKFSKVFEKLENPVGFSIDMSAEFLGGSGSGRSSRKFSKSSEIEDLLLEKLLKGPFAKTHRYGGSYSLGMDAYGFSQRSHLLLRKELEHATEENFVLCAEWNMDYPKALSVMREKFITDDMTTAGSIDIGFGKSCTSDRRITIQTQFKRSDAPSFAKSASVALEEEKCIKDEIKGQGVSESCLSTRRLAAIADKAIITVNYNQMPLPLQNLTSKAENILRHWFGAYLSDNQVNVQNKPGEIRIEAVYHPVIGTMDVRNYKPQSNTFFHNIEVNPIAEAIVPFHARLSAYRAAFGGPGLCYVGPRSVTTFDGLNYNTSLTGCDHVIAKDCSARYKMAVLAREEGNKKIVTVLLNKEKIEINPAAIAVRINNVDQSISGRKMHVVDDLKQIIATVRHTPDGFIEVVSPTHWIKVTVNPKEVIIMSSPVHRGRMCGLCGTQSGDKTDDLTGPRKCSLPSDLMDVAYQINRPSGCKSYSVSSNRIAELRQIQQTCSVEPFNPLTRTTGYQSKLGSMWKRDIWSAESWAPRKVIIERKGPVSPFGPSGPVSPFGPSGPVSPVDETSWIPDEYSLPLQHRGMTGSRFGGKRAAPTCTVLRNRQVFRNGMRCYSITALPKCAQGCRPVGTTTRKLGFHCLARGRLTEHLNKELQARPLDEMSNKEIHVMQSYKIPTGCAPAF